MVKAVRVREVGGPEVLRWEEVEVGEPGEGEIRIRQQAIGLNFIDVYFRKGVYKAPELPFTPGMEGVGVVTAVGPGLTGRKLGDVVAYAGVMGGYAEERLIAADKVVPVPPSLDASTVAAALLKGMTAQFLLRRCFKVEPGHHVLVHAAAGGVGSLLCQWARALGAVVIGVVSQADKVQQAVEDGCNHVVVSSQQDFAVKVMEITGGKGVEVVYDSVGKATFQGSLDSLAPRGYFVTYGNASGVLDPVPIQAIQSKSLFLTRPCLPHYTSTRDELLATASELFTMLASAVLKIRVNQTYPLAQVAQAHADLEARKTTGSTVLIP